jgi:hypothetical protein
MQMMGVRAAALVMMLHTCSSSFTGSSVAADSSLSEALGEATFYHNGTAHASDGA